MCGSTDFLATYTHTERVLGNSRSTFLLDYTRRAGWPRRDCMCRTWQISIIHCNSQNINFFLEDWKPSLSPFPANRVFCQKLQLFPKKVSHFLEKWAIPSPVQTIMIGFCHDFALHRKTLPAAQNRESVTVAIVTRKNHLKSGRRRRRREEAGR